MVWNGRTQACRVASETPLARTLLWSVFVGNGAGVHQGVGVVVQGKRYQVFSIKEILEKDEKKSVWLKAGSAWVNRDGSINVYLDVLPLDGKLHVREAIDEKRAESPGQAAHQAASAEALGGH